MIQGIEPHIVRKQSRWRIPFTTDTDNPEIVLGMLTAMCALNRATYIPTVRTIG